MKMKTKKEKKINVSLERGFRALGTDIHIQIVINDIEDERKASENIARLEKLYKEKERILSRFDSHSEISLLNNNLGKFIDSSEDIIYLAKKSLEYYKKSDGLFDPRILETLEEVGYKKDFKENAFDEEIKKIKKNNQLRDLSEDFKIDDDKVSFSKKMDFAGIAKGYITDKAVEFLRGRGWKNFLIDSGGDIFASGVNREGEIWGISLEGSEDENEVLVNIMDKGIATSGITRKTWNIKDGRVHHIINPKENNNFKFDLKSVTVIADKTEEADVMAKVLFLMGSDEGMKYSNKKGIRSAFLLENGELMLSKNFK